MSYDFNHFTAIGRLGKDPEIRFMTDGKAVANFSIACGESWTDKTTGEKKEKMEWIPIVIWGKLAEVAGKYLKKGSRVLIAGKLQTRVWEDKEGAKRSTTEIIVNTLQMLDSKSSSSGAAAATSSNQTAAPEDDVPF